LNQEDREMALEGEPGGLKTLEERVGILLTKYQELKKENEELGASLTLEREKVARLEKKMSLLSTDKEEVKSRIDQLLLQLKVIDV
jgi:phage shock protein A